MSGKHVWEAGVAFWKGQPLAILSLCISILSFGTSGFVLWNTWLKPFEPVGSIGMAILQGNKGTWQPRMIVPVRIVNNGASVGTIDDLAIRCTFQSQANGQSSRCNFFPTGFYSPDFLSKKIAGKPEVEFYKQLFAPILLLPREEFSELVHFSSEPPPCHIMMPSQYKAEVLLRTKNSPWTIIDTFDGTFDQSTLDKLMSGTDIQNNQSTYYQVRRKELLR